MGAFVERLGGTTLARRAARVASIERGEVLEAMERVEASSVRVRSAGEATSSTAAIHGLADDRGALAPESVGTGVATVSDKRAPERRRRVGALSASLIVLVLGLGVALAIALRVRRTPAPSASAPAIATPTLPQVQALEASDAAPNEPPSAAHPRAEDAPRKAPASARPHPRAHCAPPYTVDARGVHHYKPECL